MINEVLPPSLMNEPQQIPLAASVHRSRSSRFIGNEMHGCPGDGADAALPFSRYSNLCKLLGSGGSGGSITAREMNRDGNQKRIGE